MISLKFVFIFFGVGCLVHDTSGAPATSVTKVEPKTVGTGGTTITIYGRNFGSEFSITNTNLGNHVYLVTVRNGKATSKTKCPVDKFKSKTTGRKKNDQKLLCNPPPRALKENTIYCVRLEVWSLTGSRLIKRPVLGRRLCGGKINGDACCFKTKWIFTPTINSLVPSTLTPARDMSIEICGRIFTSRYGDSTSSANGRTESIVGISAPGQCELQRNVDANGDSYAISLAEDSDEGCMICTPKTSYVGCANVNYTVDGQMGRAIANGNVHRLSWDGKSCMLQYYPVVTHLSTNYGSKLGGQVVRIFTPNAELGGNGTNSTYSAARCFIGETEGQVIGCEKDVYCDCLVGPEPESWPYSHIGSRGPTVEVWEDGTFASLDDIMDAPATNNTHHLDVSSFCNHGINWNQTRTIGLFYATDDGVYVFEMRASFCGKFFFEDDGVQVPQGESRGPWVKGDYWRLTADTYYKITVVAGGPSCNPAPSAAINPCVALRAKYYGDDTDPNLVMSTGGNFELETQILRIRSEQTPESQRIDFDVAPTTEPVYEVQMVYRKYDSRPFVRFGMYNTLTGPLNIEDLTGLEAGLNDELLGLGPEVTVKAERDINPLATKITFISGIGGFPLLQVIGDRITVTRITQGKPDNNIVSFTLGHGGRPSTPISMAEVANYSTSGLAKIQGAVESLFTAWCPKRFWKNSLFSEDFEGEQSDYYPGAIEKNIEAYCGRQSMRNAWRWYPINREKQGNIPMADDLYINFALKGIKKHPRLRVGYIDQVSGRQDWATFLILGNHEHSWKYTSVDVSKYKKEHRYLFEIRFYGDYKDAFWVDALSMTKTPPFPNDGDDITSMRLPPASPNPGGKVRIKDVVVTAAEEGGYLITFYPFNCGRGFQLLGIMNGQPTDLDNNNVKMETLLGGSTSMTTTRISAATAKAAGTVELEFTRQTNRAFIAAAKKKPGATRKRKLNATQLKRQQNRLKRIYKRTRRTINILADILAIRRTIESLPNIGRVLTELSPSSTCANKDIMFTFETRKGRQNVFKVVSNNLTPNGPNDETTATIIRHVEGHRSIDPIRGDQIYESTDKPQTQLYINGIPAECTGDCTYEWKDEATPSMSSLEKLEATASTTVDETESVAGVEGSNLRINGTMFSEIPEDNVVMIGSYPCDVFGSTETWIVCTATAGVGYDLPISVNVAGLGFAAGDLSFSYTTGVDSIAPLSGSFGGGQELTVDGWGFPESANVFVDDRICSRTSWSPQAMRCIVPPSSVSVTRTRKNSLDEFEFDQIQPLTMDYAALRVSKHQCRSRFLGSKDMHRSLYVFDFGHIHTADIGVTWPWTVAVVFFNFRTIQNISMTLLAGFNYQQGNRTVAVTVQYTTAEGQIIEHSPDDYSYSVEQTGVINVSLSDFPSTTRIFGGDPMTFAGIRFGTSQQLVIGDATVARESVSEIDDTTTVTFETPPNLTHDTIHPLCLFIDDYGCAVLENGDLPEIRVVLRWDDISPRESSLYGGTILYIYGEGFGYNLDIVAVTVADYLCVPIDVIDTKITCQIEYTYYTEKVTNMGDGDLGAYFSCDPQNTEIAAGDTVKFEWYAPEYDWSSPSIDSPDEGDDDETAEVTWLYTINQTNEVDDLTNMENGITCGESTPAGSCDITFTVPGEYHFWSGYLDPWETMYFTCTVDVSEREAWAAEVVVKVSGKEPSYEGRSKRSATNGNQGGSNSQGNSNSQAGTNSGQGTTSSSEVTSSTTATTSAATTADPTSSATTADGTTAEPTTGNGNSGNQGGNNNQGNNNNQAGGNSEQDTCQELTSEMLGCQAPNLPSTNPLRPSILHHECVTPAISDISFPEFLTDYTRGVTVSTEILLTGSRIPSDACALRATLGSGENACACEIVGSPDVDENFEGTFKCVPALACLTHVGILREMHVEVKGLGFALIKVPYNKRFFQVLHSISAITPGKGSVAGGTEVTIESSGGFNLEENILEVKFNATVAQCNTLDDTSIRCFSPPSDTLDTGVADIEIKVNGYSSVCLLDDGSACDFVYELGITPVIFDVTPPSIDTVDQTPVTITGENFGTNISKIEVRIGGQKCDVNQLTSNISCTLIGLPAGQNLVEVLVKGIGKAQSEQYIEGIPALYDVQPPNGSIYGGTPVSLTGHGFYDNYTFIDIGGYPCNLKENEPSTLSTIVCETPPVNQDGVYQGEITVEQSWDNNAIFPAFDFHYSTLATPYVVSHIPTDGIGGDLLHVQLFLPQPDILQDFGLNFDSNWTMNSKNDLTDVFTITLGGIECPIVNATYPEIPFVDLTCTIGSRLSGHVDGLVHVKGIGNSDNFQFTYDMVLDSVDPTSGGTQGGQIICLHGVGFLREKISVTICGEICPLLPDRSSTTELCCVTPPVQAEGACPVTINDGVLDVTSSDVFTYYPNLGPSITSMESEQITTGEGVLVTLHGSEFGTDEGTATINGNPCDPVAEGWTNAMIECIVSNSLYRSGHVEVQVMSSTGTGEQVAFYEQPQWIVTQRWSSRCTWKHSDPAIDECGDLPQEGEIVVIQANQIVILDKNTPILKLLLISGGSLRFAQNDDIQLNAENILITDGGVFEIGTESHPFDGNAEIVLHGNVRSTELPIYGAKGLSLRNGSLGLYGKDKNKTSTFLSAPAKEGDTQIRVPFSDVADWYDTIEREDGNKIVIATTSDYTSQNQSEELTMIGLTQEGDDALITLDEPLGYNHSATYEDYTASDGTTKRLEFRALVVLLSRNIVFRGSVNDFASDTTTCNPDAGLGEPDSCGQERFGEEVGFDKFGAIMTVHGANENSTLNVKIENVEFTYVGQAYRMSRNPVGFHMTGDTTGSYVNKSSFHNSFNRAITLNGANNIEINKNVVFGIDASAFFIGDATGNTFDGNVAVNVKSIPGGLNTDFTAACFLISNPDNDIINNVAVGCDSHGFWFNLPIHPTGPSLDDTVCLQNTPLGKFSRNTAHSNGRYGIFTFETFTPQMDGSTPPPNGICKQKPRNAISATFSETTAWNNFVGVGFVNGSGLRCDYCILVQNSHANFRGVTSVLGPKISYSWPARKKRGVVAAYSLGDVFYGLSNSVIVGRTYSDALWQPNQGVNGVTEIGAAIPFGYSVGIENTAFINYNVQSTYPLQWTKIRENYSAYSCYPLWVLGLTFENVYHKGIFRWMYEAVVHDVDNSLECSPGDSGPSKILPYLPILSPDSYETCTWFDNSLIEAISVHDSMQFHQFSFDVIHPSYFENKAGFSRDNRSMTATYSRRREGKLGRGFSVTLPDCGDGGGPIRWHFENSEHIQNISVKIVISDVQPGDFIVFEMDKDKKPDRFSFDCGRNLIPEKEDGNLTHHGDWIFNETVVRFAIAGDDPRGLRRSITGYSDDIYICLSMYKCLFDGCIPPPPEDDRPPSMEREDGCRRYDEFEWMVNPNNPQEVLSLIDQDEESSDNTNTTAVPPEILEQIADDFDVTIAKGHCVVVCPNRLPSRMGILKLLGVMEFSDDVSDCGPETFDYNLTVSNVIIQGGRLIVGRPDHPFEGTFDLQISGGSPYLDPNTRSPLNDARNVLGVLGGLDLHGRNRTMWTPLLATASPGDKVLRLAETSNWKTGDTIIITSTSYDPNETEEREIVAINENTNENTNEVTVNEPLSYTHIVSAESVPDATESYGLSAVVGSITSNIKLRSDPEEYQDGYGAYLLVTVGRGSVDGRRKRRSSDEKTFTGFARLSYVEFINFGQPDYGEPPNVRSALTFLWTNEREAKPHGVIGCSLYNSYSTAIAVYSSDGIRFYNNVVYGASGNAVKIATSGTQLLYNLVALVRWPGTMYYRSNLHAGIRAFGTNRLIGNIVVGSTGAAYRVPPATTGATCSGTICYDDETSNVAVASSMGWVLFPTDSVLHNGVNFVSGFKFWKIAHMAVYYNSKNSVQFSCLFFADNGLDIFPMVYGPSAIEHKVEGKFVTVCDSMMIGYSSTMDCDRDTIPTGDYMNFYRSCSAPKGEDDSKYSVIFAQFIQEINYAHYNKETCTGFTKYMSLRGHMEVKGVTFMNFGAIRNCPAKFPLATNPTNEDINHPVYARDNRMKNVPEDFRLEIHSPDLSKVRSVGARQTRNAHSTDRTCGDLVCSGLYTAILTDTDGTFTGERGSVTSATDDKWNDPAWGRGDDKIPRAMMTDRRGRRKSIDEIRKYIGLGRRKNAVKKRRKHKQKETFFYKTPETAYVILVIESLDRDTEIRRLGPVAIRVTVDGDSYLEILNEPEDHYYCSGYPCGKRLSTYFAPIPDIPGVRVDIYTSGTLPERTRLFLMRPGPNSALVVSFFLTNSMRSDVYCKEGIERHYPKCTRRLDDDRLVYENKPAAECMPTPDDGACANYIDRDDRLLYFIVKGDEMIIIKRAKIVVVVLWLPDIKLDDFYKDNLIRNIAALLGVTADKIRILRAISGGSGNRRKREANSGTEFQIEVGDEPPPTAYEDTAETFINEGDEEAPDLPDPQQQIADTLMAACQDTTIVQSLGLDGVTCEAVETEEKTYVPAVPKTLVFQTELLPQHERVPFATQPKLRAVDSLGDVIDDLGIKQNTWQVTAKLRNDTGHPDAVLSGLTTISSIDGWFNFTNLTISHAGEGYIVDFEITYPPSAAELKLNTTSAMFNVSAVPMVAEVYAMTNGDIIENSEFSVTFELHDSFTGQTIEDINWRGHTFNIDCGLPDFTDFSTISGNVPKAFDNMTGRVEFDTLTMSGCGLIIMECHVTSTPAEFDFLFYQKVYVIGSSQVGLPRDVSDIITVRFKDDFDTVLHSDMLVAQLEQVLLQRFAKSHPYIVFLDSSIYEGSIMVTLTAEGSLGNITALKQDICGVIRDKQSYTVGSTTLTLDGFLEVDGQEYFETLCVVSDKDETLHPGYIALIAVIGLILLIGVALFVRWKVCVKQKTKPHVPGQYKVFNYYTRNDPEIYNIKFRGVQKQGVGRQASSASDASGVQKQGVGRQASSASDASDTGKADFLGGAKDMYRESTLDSTTNDGNQPQHSLYNSDLKLDLRSPPYLRRIVTADSGLELPGTPNLSRTPTATSGLDTLYNDDPLTPRDIITLTPTAD